MTAKFLVKKGKQYNCLAHSEKKSNINSIYQIYAKPDLPTNATKLRGICKVS